MNKKRIFIGIAALLALLLAVEAVRYITAGDKGPLTLYGNVDIRTVSISFRVSGRLDSLLVDEGDAIVPGRIIGRIDPRPFENALAEAAANVRGAKARLSLLREGYREEEIAVARSRLAEAEANYAFAGANARRLAVLARTNAVSKNEADNARAASEAALATVQAAKDTLRQYESGSRVQDILQAEASLAQAEAAEAQARLNLEDTVLMAPSFGTIMTRAVEPGTMLGAGSPVFTLSLTRPVWVRAYVDGINLARAVPGAAVDVFIDARPDRPYRGTIGFVSPTAEFTPKTVQTPELRTDLVYRLRIIVEDPDDMLRQGMPVTIVVPDIRPDTEPEAQPDAPAVSPAVGNSGA